MSRADSCSHPFPDCGLRLMELEAGLQRIREISRLIHLIGLVTLRVFSPLSDVCSSSSSHSRSLPALHASRSASDPPAALRGLLDSANLEPEGLSPNKPEGVLHQPRRLRRHRSDRRVQGLVLGLANVEFRLKSATETEGREEGQKAGGSELDSRPTDSPWSHVERRGRPSCSSPPLGIPLSTESEESQSLAYLASRATQLTRAYETSSLGRQVVADWQHLQLLADRLGRVYAGLVKRFSRACGQGRQNLISYEMSSPYFF
ncbi:unnamed protein product [Protopolystoma xenopodis]|uniref:Uncharacterized protein n=1 Tax=Protopolystoma xenopodis TaxID=117903 RepID=A0A3S5CVL4_9PLAT|nr:unnamed protein product [Protopolystoma xenopodis]